MSNLFSGKNIVIAGLLGLILAYSSYVAYSVLHKEPVAPIEPDAPVLVLNKSTFEIGDQIQIKVKHNRDAKYTVNWTLLDGYSFKNDYTVNNVDFISFGTGAKDKTLLLIVNVNYLIDNDIKSYTLTALVKIGAAPNPPNPNPPTPNPTPSFPDETLKLSTFSYTEFSKITHPKRVELAQGFANKIDSMVAAINAGTKKDSEAALKELTLMNNALLSQLNIDRTVVVPYFTALQIKLVEIDNQIGFERIDNLRKAFMEISIGLKAIK